MEQFLLQNRTSILWIAGVTAIAMISVISIQFASPDLALAQSDQTEDVDVTATVEGYLTLTVSTSSVALSPSLVTSAGDENIGTSPDIVADTSTNVASGFSLTIHGLNGGLQSTSATHTIDTVASTTAFTELAAGTEGYGAHVTAVDSGTVETPYDCTASCGTGDEGVGPIFAGSASSTLVVTQGSAVDNHSTTFKIKAAANKTTTPPATDYDDTVTLTATVSL